MGAGSDHAGAQQVLDVQRPDHATVAVDDREHGDLAGFHQPRRLDRERIGSDRDRVAGHDIGNARIAGMQRDLKLSSNQFEWLIWAFYITYIGFEWMTLM